MNTHQAKYETALERLQANMANWKTDMAEWKTDMAEWKTEMARRETRIILAMLGMFVAATTFLGFLIRLPNPAS